MNFCANPCDFDVPGGLKKYWRISNNCVLLEKSRHYVVKSRSKQATRGAKCIFKIEIISTRGLFRLSYWLRIMWYAYIYYKWNKSLSCIDHNFIIIFFCKFSGVLFVKETWVLWWNLIFGKKFHLPLVHIKFVTRRFNSVTSLLGAKPQNT